MTEKYSELKEQTEKMKSNEEASSQEREEHLKKIKEITEQYSREKAELVHKIDNMSDKQLARAKEKLSSHVQKLMDQNNELKQNLQIKSVEE